MKANGIGDALLGLVAVKGYQQKHGAASYSCKNQEWVRLFDGYDELLSFNQSNSININEGYQAECKSKATKPRWKRYCELAGVDPATPELKNRAKLLEQSAPYRGCIVLAPFSIYTNRNYSVEGWITLERLLLAKGHRVVLLHNNITPLARFTSEKLIGKPAEIVASVILNAACFVGVDSGMAHLASLIGTPTCVLCGPTNASDIFYTPVIEIKSSIHCQGCYWQTPYTGACDKGCAALWAITPEQILHTIESNMTLRHFSPRSLMGEKELQVIRDNVLAVKELDGECAEIGVYKGGSARIILHYSACPVHLYDTFSGQPADDMHGEHKQGDFSDTSVEAVKSYLASDRAVLHQASFPDDVADVKYKFVHFDADTYQATRGLITHIVPRMAKGGRIIVSDFGWKNTPGVKRAIAESGVPFTMASEYQAVVVC
jgi:hypothetical protein